MFDALAWGPCYTGPPMPPFPIPRDACPGARRRRARRLWVILAGLAILAVSAPAAATPLENTRLGGLNRASAVEPHPASMVRNPAAVGPLAGTHVFLDATARLELGRIKRYAIRSDTGNPADDGDITFGKNAYAHWTPDGYFALTTDLGSNLVVIGLALHTRYGELQRFPAPVESPTPAEQGSLRYHRIRAEWFHLFVAPVVAVRLHRRFYLGLGMSYVRSMLGLSYSRDIAIRRGEASYESTAPGDIETVRVTGGEDSFTFNLGLVIRMPRQVDLGISYRSQVIGVNKTVVRAEGDAEVVRYDAPAGAWHTYRGKAQVTYALPDTLAVSIKWAPQPWEFGFSFEWVRWSEHEDIDFRLTGSEFRAVNMVNWDINFTHYRGFRDVFRPSVAFAYVFKKPQLTLAWDLLYESSAVPRRWVSPSAVDQHKVDLLLAVIWRPHRNVGLHFGYSVTLAPDLDVDSSAFDPGYAVRCVEDQVDIVFSDNCRRVIEGKGLPTAAGRYWQMVHRLGFGVSYDYW